MSQTGLAPFDSTIQTTNVLLHEVMNDMGWGDRNRAYHALRAVLHALRDRLPVDVVAALGAQLPMLVRGFYYEGWHPHGKPLKERKQLEVLAHVADAFQHDPDLDAEQVTRCIFKLLRAHLTAGIIDEVKRVLPEEIRSLWIPDTILTL